MKSFYQLDRRVVDVRPPMWHNRKWPQHNNCSLGNISKLEHIKFEMKWKYLLCLLKTSVSENLPNKTRKKIIKKIIERKETYRGIF